jgi:predicted ATPase
MARLRLAQNRHDDAFAVLAPVYDRFTEGLESFDLKAARQLLDQLRSPGRPLTAGTTGGRHGEPSGF